MQVTLIGLGGAGETITLAAREALERADVIVGAARLIESIPKTDRQKYFTEYRTEAIIEILARESAARSCVVFSGDSGFFSGARSLLPQLRQRGIDCRVLPGVSSVQLLAARLGRPWQDWTLVSAHGAACDPVTAILRGKPAFFLTGGDNTPAALCRALADAGLGDVRVTVGENLAAAEERIVEATVAEAAEQAFAPLSVLLVEAVERPDVPVGGVADDMFLRGSVPMTKQEVRAAILSKLALRRTDTVWDVGAGTGSVSVELALAANEGRVCAVECADEACELIEANRRRFGAWNLCLARGTAPEALAGLPAPDAVFIGGSKGRLREIMEAALAANPAARLCVSAIAMETLSTALDACKALQLDMDIAQISVSRTRAAGALHLLTANNPVFLITAKRGEGA